MNDINQTSEPIADIIKVNGPRYAGKLLLRNEISLHETTFQHLLNHSIFKTIPSFINKPFLKRCTRCWNSKKSLIGTIPCSICGKTHLYCRKCIQMGRVLECESLFHWPYTTQLWPSHESPCTWEGELTLAQQKAADRIVQAIQTNERELLVWAVCGAGKTEMLFPGLTQALEQGKRICIATPRADVVRELNPRIKKAFASVSVQALYGGSEEKEGTAQLIIATTHQLFRFKEAFDLLIIDEIDAFPFHADASLLFAANRAKNSPSTTIYLTATPRNKQKYLMKRKKLPHVFVPVRYHGYSLPVPQMKMTLSHEKDLQARRLPKQFTSWLQKRQQPHRQILIFVPTVPLAKHLFKDATDVFLKENLIQHHSDIDFVHSEDVNREEKIEQFRNQDLTVIITTTILERGVTFPSVDVAVLDAGHDVFNEAALVQIAGRAGRSADDPTGDVVFFHSGKTEAMVSAIDLIQEMNRKKEVNLNELPLV